MRTRLALLTLPVLAASLVVSGCSSSASSSTSSAPSKPVTKQFARESLVKAKLATVCSEEEYVVCQTPDGSGAFAVMVMSQADLDATFQRLCSAVAGPSSDPDKTLDEMKIVTDRSSFLVVGEIGLAFPTGADPSAVQKVLGGEVVSMTQLCSK
jgi:hypothetical protein